MAGFSTSELSRGRASDAKCLSSMILNSIFEVSVWKAQQVPQAVDLGDDVSNLAETRLAIALESASQQRCPTICVYQRPNSVKCRQLSALLRPTDAPLGPMWFDTNQFSQGKRKAGKMCYDDCLREDTNTYPYRDAYV